MWAGPLPPCSLLQLPDPPAALCVWCHLQGQRGQSRPRPGRPERHGSARPCRAGRPGRGSGPWAPLPLSAPSQEPEPARAGGAGPGVAQSQAPDGGTRPRLAQWSRPLPLPESGGPVRPLTRVHACPQRRHSPQPRPLTLWPGPTVDCHPASSKGQTRAAAGPTWVTGRSQTQGDTGCDSRREASGTGNPRQEVVGGGLSVAWGQLLGANPTPPRHLPPPR